MPDEAGERAISVGSEGRFYHSGLSTIKNPSFSIVAEGQLGGFHRPLRER